MKTLLTGTLLIMVFSTSAQKIGINTPIPLMQLDVRSADSASLLLYNTQTFADSAKTALYFRTGTNYTGAIKTHVQNANFQEARMGFFTYSLTNPNALLERMSITDAGNLGINTVSPAATLDVIGNIKITDGTQAPGKVLTSDGLGFGSWQTPASNSAFRGVVTSNTTVFSSAAALYTVSFLNRVYDQTGGNFDGTSFTANVSGVYHFDVNCVWSLTSAGSTYPLNMSLIFGASTEICRSISLIPAGYTGNYTTSLSMDYFLSAGNSVYVQCFQNSGASQVVLGNALTSFTGHRVF